MSRIFPKPVLTVGAIRQSNVKLKMICNACGGAFKVPVDLIATAYSDEFSLINKRVGCPGFDCHGSCAVLFQLTEWAPFLPLFRR